MIRFLHILQDCRQIRLNCKISCFRTGVIYADPIALILPSFQ